MLTATCEAAPAVWITSGMLSLGFFFSLRYANYPWIVAKESHLTEGEEEERQKEEAL